MSTNFQDVGDFHRKFGLRAWPDADGASLLDDELYAFRRDFLEEELREFRESHEAGDIAGAFDALLDLVYVAMGTAHLMGLPWQHGWNEVQRANMTKLRATTTSMGPRENSSFDIIKGPDFVPPDIHGVLARQT